MHMNMYVCDWTEYGGVCVCVSGCVLAGNALLGIRVTKLWVPLRLIVS